MDQLDFVGNILSLDCGESLGVFQGVVTSVNKEKQTVSLRDTYRNGVKYEVQEVTIRAIDIKDLKVLKVSEFENGKKDEQNGKENEQPRNGDIQLKKGGGRVSKSNIAARISHSKSPVRKSTVSKSGCASAGTTPQKPDRERRSRPASSKLRDNRSDGEFIDCDGHNSQHSVGRSKSFSNTPRSNGRPNTPENGSRRKTHNGAHLTLGGDSTDEEVAWNDRGRRRRKSGGQGTNSRYRSSPVKVEGKRGSFHQRKNEECFSAPVESFLDDFDFGKNLALFDKAAVFEEIDAMTDGAHLRKKKEQFLKPHENVLDDDEAEAVDIADVKMEGSGGYHYLSENGVKIPAASSRDRAAVFKRAEGCGFSLESRVETVGLCCSQLVLGMIGGCQRLKPGNNHQKPTVVLLCGSHPQGAQGVCCGRHLSQHHARVVVCVPSGCSPQVQRELQLFKETDGEVILSPKELPTTPVDLIISALHTPDRTIEDDFSTSAIQWATKNSKACILSLDPCKHQNFNSKWSIFVGLPLHGSASLGNIYLCDPGIPSKFYKPLGDSYIVPYGSKFMIPLEDT